MRFGKQTTDILETRLFGAVDKKGALAAAFFSEYRDYVDSTIEMFRDLVWEHNDLEHRAGLDLIKKQYGVVQHTQALMLMNDLFSGIRNDVVRGNLGDRPGLAIRG